MQLFEMDRECACCGGKDSIFLFNVLYRGNYNRLCTACVLKNNPSSFCTLCFDVFDENDVDNHHNRRRVVCIRCPSVSHWSCTAATRPYICPICSNPNFSFFDCKKAKGIGEDSARQMLAAAKISVDSMNRGAVLAAMEAENKAIEAVVAMKRAKESLERVFSMEDDDCEGDSDD